MMLILYKKLMKLKLNNFEYITKIKDYNLFSFSSLFLIQINVNQFALSLINEYVITILEIENIKN